MNLIHWIKDNGNAVDISADSAIVIHHTRGQKWYVEASVDPSLITGIVTDLIARNPEILSSLVSRFVGRK